MHMDGMDGMDGTDGRDATSWRYLNDKRIKYTIQAYKSSLSPPLTHFHLLLTPNHRTDHRDRPPDGRDG